MGFQDRDYYREGSQSIYVTSMVVKLIIINGIVFFVSLLLGVGKVEDFLGVHADTIVRPLFWWQFLTAGFVHDSRAINHILFNMLGLYCFGMPMEERYGRREFLRFYLVAIVLGFVIWSATNYHWLQSTAQNLAPAVAAERLRNYTCIGASGGVTAVTLLFCLLNPRATILLSFIFPVPAWLVGGLIVFGNLFLSTQSSMGGVAYDVHLVGAALALAYWYFGWNFGQLPGLYELKRLLAAPKRWLKAKPPLKVHNPEQYYEDLDAQADRLLDKVNREGLSSLTDQERRILEDYSRRTRQKLR
jgi:membrane associated rhomboid family serine protease